MSAGKEASIHASAVRLGPAGILIRGPSGSGKSSLALALLDGGAELIADDRVELSATDAGVQAAAVAAIAGLIEVRGQGIFQVPYRSPAPIHLVVDLCPPEDCPRHPEPQDEWTMVEGFRLPCLRLPIGTVDGAVRVRWAIAHGAEKARA